MSITRSSPQDSCITCSSIDILEMKKRKYSQDCVTYISSDDCDSPLINDVDLSENCFSRKATNLMNVDDSAFESSSDSENNMKNCCLTIAKRGLRRRAHNKLQKQESASRFTMLDTECLDSLSEQLVPDLLFRTDVSSDNSETRLIIDLELPQSPNCFSGNDIDQVSAECTQEKETIFELTADSENCADNESERYLRPRTQDKLKKRKSATRHLAQDTEYLDSLSVQPFPYSLFGTDVRSDNSEACVITDISLPEGSNCVSGKEKDTVNEECIQEKKTVFVVESSSNGKNKVENICSAVTKRSLRSRTRYKLQNEKSATRQLAQDTECLDSLSVQPFPDSLFGTDVRSDNSEACVITDIGLPEGPNCVSVKEKDTVNEECIQEKKTVFVVESSSNGKNKVENICSNVRKRSLRSRTQDKLQNEKSATRHLAQNTECLDGLPVQPFPDSLFGTDVRSDNSEACVITDISLPEGPNCVSGKEKDTVNEECIQEKKTVFVVESSSTGKNKVENICSNVTKRSLRSRTQDKLQNEKSATRHLAQDTECLDSLSVQPFPDSLFGTDVRSDTSEACVITDIGLPESPNCVSGKHKDTVNEECIQEKKTVFVVESSSNGKNKVENICLTVTKRSLRSRTRYKLQNEKSATRQLAQDTECLDSLSVQPFPDSLFGTDVRSVNSEACVITDIGLPEGPNCVSGKEKDTVNEECIQEKKTVFVVESSSNGKNKVENICSNVRKRSLRSRTQDKLQNEKSATRHLAQNTECLDSLSVQPFPDSLFGTDVRSDNSEACVITDIGLPEGPNCVSGKEKDTVNEECTQKKKTVFAVESNSNGKNKVENICSNVAKRWLRSMTQDKLQNQRSAARHLAQDTEGPDSLSVHIFSDSLFETCVITNMDLPRSHSCFSEEEKDRVNDVRTQQYKTDFQLTLNCDNNMGNVFMNAAERRLRSRAQENMRKQESVTRHLVSDHECLGSSSKKPIPDSLFKSDKGSLEQESWVDCDGEESGQTSSDFVPVMKPEINADQESLSDYSSLSFSKMRGRKRLRRSTRKDIFDDSVSELKSTDYLEKDFTSVKRKRYAEIKNVARVDVVTGLNAEHSTYQKPVTDYSSTSFSKTRGRKRLKLCTRKESLEDFDIEFESTDTLRNDVTPYKHKRCVHIKVVDEKDTDIEEIRYAVVTETDISEFESSGGLHNDVTSHKPKRYEEINNVDNVNMLTPTKSEHKAHQESITDSSASFSNMMGTKKLKQSTAKEFFEDSTDNLRNDLTSYKPKRYVKIKVVDEKTNDIDEIRCGVVGDLDILENSENKTHFKQFTPTSREEDKEGKSLSISDKKGEVKKQKIDKHKSCTEEMSSGGPNTASENKQRSQKVKCSYDFNMGKSKGTGRHHTLDSVNDHDRPIHLSTDSTVTCRVTDQVKNQVGSSTYKVINDSREEAHHVYIRVAGPTRKMYLIGSSDSDSETDCHKVSPMKSRETTLYPKCNNSHSQTKNINGPNSHTRDGDKFVATSNILIARWIVNSEETSARRTDNSPLFSAQKCNNDRNVASTTKGASKTTELSKIRAWCQTKGWTHHKMKVQAGCSTNDDKFNRITEQLKRRESERLPQRKSEW